MHLIRAFSLVELSIVLVILGLLVGGVLAGKSLITASELRSASSDMKKYETAYYSFIDRYRVTAGDITNATSFWGIAGGTGSNAACYAVSSTGPETCNGNGDGQVYTGPSASYREYWHYWKQLANAGLIEGSFTGANGTSGVAHAMPGGNVPALKLRGGAVNISRTAKFTSGDLAQSLYFGLATTSTTEPLFSAEEMWNIDTKTDDGYPGSGKVYTKGVSTYPGCTTTDVATTAEYDLASSGLTCVIFFMLKDL